MNLHTQFEGKKGAILSKVVFRSWENWWPSNTTVQKKQREQSTPLTAVLNDLQGELTSSAVLLTFCVQQSTRPHAYMTGQSRNKLARVINGITVAGVDGKSPNALTESGFSIFRNCHLEVSRGFKYQSILCGVKFWMSGAWYAHTGQHLCGKSHEYLEQHAEHNYPHIPSEMQLRQYMKEGSVSMCPSCNGRVHDTVNKIH